MGKTGVELPKLPATGVDTEQLKAHLKFHSDNSKLNNKIKEQWVEKLFSPHFFVFIITIFIIASGFVVMIKDGSERADIVEYWKLILPVITTYIGYAIGKGKSE